MTIRTCGVIDTNGNIVNVILADPAVDTVEGHTLIASDAAAIGGTYLKGVFAAPPAPSAPPRPPAPTLADLQAQMAGLAAQIKALASGAK